MRTPYPEYDILENFDYWDEQTQAVVRKRLDEVPAITFFTEEEAGLLAAVDDRIMPQHVRAPQQRVPIVPFIDEMLAPNNTDGFRQPDMPWSQAAWRQGLAGIEETSGAMQGRAFAELEPRLQHAILAAIQEGDPPGDTWQQLPAKKFFKELVQQIAAVYYAHPAAWSEIGWGGPAKPRSYVRLGYGMRDLWDSVEREPASVEIARRKAKTTESSSGAGGATH